jgi:hypothetical protein
MGIRCADHVTPLYLQKLAVTSPTGGGRSVGIVRLRTKATEYSFSFSPCGTLLKEQGFSNLVQNMGHKEPVLKPRCMGSGRAQIQIPFNSIQKPCQSSYFFIYDHIDYIKGKATPLQSWTGPEGSSRLKLPDFKTFGT